MKRILSLLLALSLLLPCLAACDSAETPSSTESGTTSGNPAWDADSEEAAETEPDYSWFEMPGETDRLVVYSNGDSLKSVLDPAVRIFREQYPEVEVDYQVFGQDEYGAAVRTEIPAGKGPDLLLLEANTVQDIYKTMSTGLFENLDPYFTGTGKSAE